MESKIIVRKLNFLITEYNCNYIFKKDVGDCYYYTNNFFKINIYEFKEFNDLKISLIVNNQAYNIDPAIEKPKEYNLINKKKNGLRGLFYFNYDEDFWELVAKILKEKIVILSKWLFNNY